MEVHLKYERRGAPKAAADVRFFSGQDPANYQIFKYERGLDIMRNANSAKLPPDARYELPLADIAELWRRGSVVSSWLLDLTADALAENSAATNDH